MAFAGVEMLLIFLIGGALTNAFGRMVGDQSPSQTMPERTFTGAYVATIFAVGEMIIEFL